MRYFIYIILLFGGVMQAQSTIKTSYSYNKVESLKKSQVYFEKQNFLKYSKTLSDKIKQQIPKSIGKYEVFEVDKSALDGFIKNRNLNAIALALQGLEGEQMVLDLYEVDFIDDQIELSTSEGLLNSDILANSRFFHGTIRNDASSAVAISFQNGKISGLISGLSGEFMISALATNDGEGENSNHILYQTNLATESSFDCGVDDSNLGPPFDMDLLIKDQIKSSFIIRCVSLNIYVENDLFLKIGSVNEVVSYVTELMNNVSLIYENEFIRLELAKLHIYTKPGVLSDPSLKKTGDLLFRMVGTLNSLKGVSILLMNRGNGGMAWTPLFKKECYSRWFLGIRFTECVDLTPKNIKRFCVNNVDFGISSIQLFPNFSWPVKLVAHELGHVLGSPHTHACYWNGNSTPIDGCVLPNQNGNNNPTSTCERPGLPAEGGTIMSYCHLSPEKGITGVGINFKLGFGPQPGALIRAFIDKFQDVYSASSNCSGVTFSCSNGIQDEDETGIDCGGLYCLPCVTCTDGLQNGGERGVDCGGPDCPPCGNCEDGVQNAGETGIDCGGLYCPPCPTCEDGIQNGDESGIDCGGSDCSPCPTCEDGIQNGDEAAIDCGGSACKPCPTPCPVPSGLLTANIRGFRATLKWGNITSAQSYQVQIKAAEDLSWKNFSTSISSLSILGNMQGTIYEWRVRAVCQGTQGEWSAICNFVGGDPLSGYCPPAAPTCEDGLQNGDEAGVDCGGVNCPVCPTCDDGLQNGDETGIDCGGGICLPCAATCEDGLQNGDEAGVDCGGVNCPVCPTCDDGLQNGNETGIDCGGGACLPCAATCDDGLQNGDETGVDCGGSACVPCYDEACLPPTNPSEENVINTSARLKWLPVGNALSYEVALVAEGSNRVFTYSTRQNAISVRGLIRGTTYQWQVRTDCGSGVISNWSVVKTFVAGGSGSSLQTGSSKLSPSCGNAPGQLFIDQVKNTSVRMNWEPSVAVQYYKMRIRKAGTIPWREFLVFDHSVITTDLVFGAEYEWAIAGVCDNALVSWSDHQTFIAGNPYTQAGSSDIATIKKGLKAWPNPVVDYLNVTLNYRGEDNIVLRLMDLQGGQIQIHNVPDNEGTIRLEVGQLPKGVYILSVSNGNFRDFEKIIIQ